MEERITLGIDPGLATTGFGVIKTYYNDHTLIDYGTILTPPNLSLSKRLVLIATQLNAVISKHAPESVAVEELFFCNNAKTALKVGQARGVILYILEAAGLDIHGYTPLQIKMGICGYGKADKKQVQYMVKNILNLSTTPKPDDAADALAVAICHNHSIKLKSLV